MCSKLFARLAGLRLWDLYSWADWNRFYEPRLPEMPLDCTRCVHDRVPPFLMGRR